ncbi:nucleotidyltransferase domain-containing protein [Actinoplanes utahensis]|uniref:Polymerase nucleotidyl transferase domain-containing protein n=1 Tax=Actinoplanes utahensis TaxID=1869 RepID=A0A0A6UQX0_ACTUT|nr:nucleotidyltransferase domain-containing protein [Actinoplanes utahensis]KHD77443.1 hypothetical protein MB27_11800 [Actinoplanes utahensis]
MDVIERLIADAEADPDVHGVVLTGSWARGLATAHSDYDVTVVVASTALERWRRIRTARLDQAAVTAEQFADTSVHWQRYAYRGARILLDRLGGGVAELVAKQSIPTEREAAGWSRDFLDAYVNQLYRAVKSRRDGSPAAARLDEIESVQWLLATVFALHGRLRPYNRYLAWELATYPLPEPWTAALAPEHVADRVLTLFPEVAELARRRGHGAVLDGWGGDIALILDAAR